MAIKMYRTPILGLLLALGITACGDNDSVDKSPYSTQIVSVKQVTPDDNPTSWGYSQIFRMDADGSNPINLSNRGRDEKMPSVSYDSKQIAFVSNANNLFVMGIDGSDMKLVANAPNDVGYPKWGRGIHGRFILYSYPYSLDTSAIFRINPDGSNLTQLTNPGTNEKDGYAVSIDDQHIVFTRGVTNIYPDWRSDLYIKNIVDGSSEVLLTNTPANCEIFLPVASHNRKMLAYRVWDITSGIDWVHIAEFSGHNSISTGRDIKLTTPAGKNITGIDFSADDRSLILSLEATDVSASYTSRRQEIFSVSIDGSNQKRLTLNSDMDVYPSVVP
jgi:Tol biopolymer transport system component